MNKNYPKVIIHAIDIFKSLPGVGARSAERMVLSMINWDDAKINALSELLKIFPESIGKCEKCGNLSEKNSLCYICKSPIRNEEIICIVEDFTQINNMEKSSYKGLYHVLGGKLSPLSGKNPEDLNINSLIDRIKSNEVKEVVFALSSDIEGQATAVYLSNLLKDYDIEVSQLAHGIPIGADISYADSATLQKAISARIKLN